jgi:hypothetical protein
MISSAASPSPPDKLGHGSFEREARAALLREQ